RRNAERNDVCNRIQLNAEVAGGLCEAGNTTVETVKDIADADEYRGIVPVAAQRRYDRKVTAEDISDGKQAGNDGKAPVYVRRFANASSVASVSHILSLMTAIALEPPRTRIFGLTIASDPAGSRTSTRDPNRIRPISSPFVTVSPGRFQHTIR